jgi:hypothetical protein
VREVSAAFPDQSDRRSRKREPASGKIAVEQILKVHPLKISLISAFGPFGACLHAVRINARWH